MKALTIIQPWASLIAAGYKIIETRSWATPYRGPLAIHAGKNAVFLRLDLPPGVVLQEIPLGYVVATAELVDCIPTAKIPLDLWKRRIWGQRSDAAWDIEQQLGDYSGGRFAWLLANVTPLAPPVKARGQQGLWEWERPA